MAKTNDELEREIKDLKDRVKTLEELVKKIDDNFEFGNASKFKEAVRAAIKEKL